MNEPNDVDARGMSATHWSLIERAGAAPGAGRREALDELLRRYLVPMRRHLCARFRMTPADAEDRVQSFIAARVLDANLLARADRSRGRFRNFLLTALNRFVCNELRNGRALSRSTESNVHLDDEINQPTDTAAPADAFEIEWARQVLRESLGRMEKQCITSNRRDIWAVFNGRVLSPTIGQDEAVPYEQLVAEFGFASPSQASNVLITANRMFARTMREVIGEYESDLGSIDEEIAALRMILSSARESN